MEGRGGMTIAQARVNGIDITYEDKGPRGAPAILLVMGLGGQLTLWPDEFVAALNDHGFRTIRYANRDVGLSTRFASARLPNLKWLFVKAAIGLPVRKPHGPAHKGAEGTTGNAS